MAKLSSLFALLVFAHWATAVPVATASDTLQLILEGEIALDFFEPGGPSPDDLGLRNGDLVQFLFEFDSELQPFFPGGNETGSPIQRYEARINGQDFLPPADGGFVGQPLGEIRARQTVGTGVAYDIDQFSGLTGSLNGIDLNFGVITALNLVASFETDDLGGGLSSFPRDLEFSDLVSSQSGFFGLSPVGGGGIGFGGTGVSLSVNFTDLSVNTVPEPTSAVLWFFGLAGVAMRRQRQS